MAMCVKCQTSNPKIQASMPNLAKISKIAQILMNERWFQNVKIRFQMHVHKS